MLVLDSHKTTTPDSSELFVIVELSSEVLCKELQVLIVFLSHVGESNSGSSLGVNELSESCLSLDESIGDSLLSSESWEERHELKWVNIMSHNDKLCLALLNESGDVVQTELDHEGLWGLLGILTSGLGLSLLLESGLLFLLGLWLVFCEQFKELGSYRILIISICGFKKKSCCLPWFLSIVFENWLSAGGTLSLWRRILF